MYSKSGCSYRGTYTVVMATHVYEIQAKTTYVHTTPEGFENGTEKSQLAVAFTLHRSEIV
jgi:hypothetical protein